MSDAQSNMAEVFDQEAGLTRNQFLIWLGQEVAPDKPIFNELSVFVLEGDVDVARFHEAFTHMLAEHDALRTTIRRVNGRPHAETHDELTFRSTLIDFSDRADAESALDAWALRHVDSAIDLTKRPFASTLIKLADGRYAWAMLMHQILMDATSMGVVFERVSQWYASVPAAPADGGKPIPSYADYIARQIEDRQKIGYRKRAEYWAARVADPADPVVFYDGKTSASHASGRRDRVDHALGSELTEQVHRFAQLDGVRVLSEHLSSFSVFCAALIAYLHKLSGNDRITIGAPWQNRQALFRSTVGLFMEQNPFEVRLDPDETFRTLLKKVQAEALSTLRHLPYAAGNPGGRVYDVTLNYIKTTFGTFAGIPIDHRWYRPTTGEGSIQLQVHDVTDRQDVTLSFDLSTEMFTGKAQAQVVAHYIACLTELITHPDAPIGAMILQTEDERAQLAQWNDTQRDYRHELTAVDLFETQVELRPDAVAVSFGDDRLTYVQLRDRVHDVGLQLRASGVGPGDLVGVLLDRSLDIVVALLAVLRVGAAYVPLDPAFPQERLDYMLDDSGADVVLTQSHTAGRIDAGHRRIVEIDRPGAASAAAATAAAAWPVVDPGDLAYILYTSGSTGRPKGVRIPHRALTNFLCAMADRPGCTAADVLLAVTTLSFDIAGLELYLPLIVGGRVDIAPRDVVTDGRQLRARLDAGDITIMQATPTTWRMLIDAGWSGGTGFTALVGGEALPPDLVQPLLDRTGALWNMYGPTETTIWSSVQHIRSAHEEITVGRPIANTGFHIVDARLQPVPPGIAGELLISGDGLAQGYHRRDALTAEKFVEQVPTATGGTVRMYRTGDLARFRDDGRVVHLGRLDHQVKVRGFRIELGEVEHALADHELVQQAVVIAHDPHSAAACLVAYVVPAEDGAVTAADLRLHLRSSLPDYMVPQHFITLPELPLTLNGKLDRQRLPAPQVDTGSQLDGPPPSTRMEVTVAEAFCEVLALPAVGAHADFFDLGGQSILALRLASLLSERLGVDVPLQILFEASTVASLSRRLNVMTSVTPELRTIALAGTDLEGRISLIWREAVGSDPTSDDTAPALSDLQIVALLTRVRQEFGVAAEGLSALSFRSDPTVGALTRFLRDAFIPPQELVAPLQPQGDSVPLFLIHAGGGYVFFYRALAARLAPDQPVYAIRAATQRDSHRRGFDHAVSIEDLAASYISEIKSIQPTGPYRLGGACFGGVVAFEMAQQLRRAGDAVAGPVLLFDAFVGKLDEGWADYASRTLGAVADRVGADRSVNALGLMRVLVARAVRDPADVMKLIPLTGRSLYRRARGRLSRRTAPRLLDEWTIAQTRTAEQEQLDEMKVFLDTSLRLISRYEPQRYPGSAVLLKATAGLDPEPLWRPWFDGGLEVHVTPGEHLDMMEEPWVERTAELVRSALAGDGADQSRVGSAARPQAPGALHDNDSM